MKPWPTDPKATPQADLVTPLREAYGRVMHGKPANYDGWDIGTAEKPTCLDATRAFEAMAEERTGMLERLLYLALQLGCEVGRRQHRWWMYPALSRLVQDAQRAGADVEWFREQWAEETGKPWPELPLTDPSKRPAGDGWRWEHSLGPAGQWVRDDAKEST